ncbi:MAG: metal ABC transporter ATP-binding protein [Pseudomonadota bacterium]
MRAKQGLEAPALLSCERLVIGRGGRALLPPIELTIRRGELWVVLGRNGAGKTTWARTLLGLERPIAGTVTRRKSELRLTYLAQRRELDAAYPLRVRDVVGFGLDRETSFLRRRTPEQRARLERALAEAGIAALAERPFRELSEGQQQRVLLARVHAAQADLAVLDEPTSAMDGAAEREAWALLARLRDETGLALVVITHAQALARAHADRVLVLDRDARSVVSGPPEDVVATALPLAARGAVNDEVPHDA